MTRNSMTRFCRRNVYVLIAIGALALGCGDDDTCSDGETQACECVVGGETLPGVETCTSGAYGACDCSGEDAGPSDAGPQDGDPDDSGAGCTEGETETRGSRTCGEETRTCSGGVWSEWAETREGPADRECNIGEARWYERSAEEEETLCTGDPADRWLASWLRCGADCRWESEPTQCGDGCDGARRVETRGSELIGQDEVCVPGGQFTMGCSDTSQDCSPRHVVELSPFYIDRFPVTLGRYRACVEAEVCTVLEPSYLAGGINAELELATLDSEIVRAATHEQARVFCEWDGAELVTGSQWERAATGRLDRVYFPIWDTDGSDGSRWVQWNGTDERPNLDLRRIDSSDGTNSIGIAGWYSYFEWTADSLSEPYRVDRIYSDPSRPGDAPFEVRGVFGGYGYPSNERGIAYRGRQAIDGLELSQASFRCARPAIGER